MRGSLSWRASVLLAGVLPLVSCGRREPVASSPVQVAASDTVLEPAAADAPAIAVAAAKAPLESGPVEPSFGLPLPRFYSALRVLERREEPAASVRIGWFGDSHVAADYWTGAVRAELQGRFGNGGPGFFHVGLKGYRHSMVRFEIVGAWQREPTPPSLRTRSFDGVFGLGGIRTFARSAPARFEVRPEPMALAGPGTFRVSLRLGAADRVELASGGQSREITGDRAGQGTPTSVRHESLELPGQAPLTLRVLSGRPVFFGATLESSTNGVVLDTLGIDGARAETPLAWDEADFAAALSDRAYTLLVLAYGTNEVFDAAAPERYKDHYKRLFERVKRALPEVDCLVLGPPDALDPQGATHPRVPLLSAAQEEVAGELGCAYLGAQALMGGSGSFLAWLREAPPWAQNDGIHLSPLGYRVLGMRTARALLDGYELFAQANP